jgi:HAD superfamily hydrolase (TIGR01509 family)
MNTIAVIFDMDGVLVHTNPYHLITYRKFWTDYGVFPTDEDLALHLYGKSNRYILEHFFNKKLSNEEVRQYENEKEGLFRQVYEPHVEPIAGLMTFLNGLKTNNVKTGIGTSAPRANLDLILSKIPLESIMESMLASENVSQHKPNPEIYLKSMQALGALPEHSVIFEDSHTGVLAAKAAGAKVVGVLTSHQPNELPPCDAYINDYEHFSYQDILKLLNK